MSDSKELESIDVHIGRVPGDKAIRFGFTSTNGGIPMHWVYSDELLPEGAGAYERAIRVAFKAWRDADIKLHMDSDA